MLNLPTVEECAVQWIRTRLIRDLVLGVVAGTYLCVSRLGWPKMAPIKLVGISQDS